MRYLRKRIDEMMFLRRKTVFLLLFVCLVLFGFLTSSSVSATTGTLTMSIPDGISLNILPSASGTFASTSGTISVSTTYASGYTLGIKATSNNNNALINTNDSNKTIPSITSSISESTFSTSSTYNDKWGYKPSKLNSSANSNYLQAPTSTTTTTLDQTSSSNSTANTYTIAIGTRLSNATAPGTYENTFVFTVLANPTPYTITYNANDGASGADTTNMPTPNPNSSSTYADTVTLSNTVPVRDGYNFKGWCTVQVADGAACTGTTYNPDGGGTNLTWTIDQTQSSNSITLYARWETAGPINLYNAVASMTKGTQTPAELTTSISKENSGVYEYDSSEFGTSSDASNANTIYYYRGDLDNSYYSYGSQGDNGAYPNTVVLSSASDKSGLTTNDTCWRIVRTTGSGGIKMIYQGEWDGSTCAKSGATANAISSIYFNRGTTTSTNSYETKGRLVYVGYNYNSVYAYGGSSASSATSTANSTLFTNDAPSNLRTQLESWYASNLTSYTGMLETSAGWCDDRTTYADNNASTNPSTSSIPYKTSSSYVFFGAEFRQVNGPTTLQCPNTAGNDLLTTSNGLTYPVALLTAEEAALAGSGDGSTSTPSYSPSSFLVSNNSYWLLSPNERNNTGGIYVFSLSSNGSLNSTLVSNTSGVRPTISLKAGTNAASGSGTATDPWIVTPPPPTLYDEVASAWEAEGSRVMTNDTNASTGIQAAITTSNSGVFKYNPSTFGSSSDAANTSDIYFYRGILDTAVGTYGSDGDNAAHPNTVVLSSASDKSGLTGTDTDATNADTCWRIVRTTGSGGVKMVYQGKWTGSTCANATTNAQVTTSTFSGTTTTNQNIVLVGYTYNNTYDTNTSQSGTIAQIFGTNSNPEANNARSTIKRYIEDTWYSSAIGSSSGHDYTNILEASAGYCNDRTMNTSTSWTSPLAETSTIASTYGTSNQQVYYFGAFPRNMNAAQPPSLTCGNKYSQIDRSTVDLYRYVSDSTGVSNQLKYPAALLTADEVSFAGSGESTASQGSAYHANSYLRSGSGFWLLSPGLRTSGGYASGFILRLGGELGYSGIGYSDGVRPAISLTSGTTAVSGTGTATDPWIVNP